MKVLLAFTIVAVCTFASPTLPENNKDKAVEDDSMHGDHKEVEEVDSGMAKMPNHEDVEDVTPSIHSTRSMKHPSSEDSVEDYASTKTSGSHHGSHKTHPSSLLTTEPSPMPVDSSSGADPMPSEQPTVEVQIRSTDDFLKEVFWSGPENQTETEGSEDAQKGKDVVKDEEVKEEKQPEGQTENPQKEENNVEKETEQAKATAVICSIGSMCFGDHDCPNGRCLGLAVGKCNCGACATFRPCSKDSDCGGLVGACDHDVNYCNCDKGFQFHGQTLLDAWINICNRKDCIPETMSCYGLPCNAGLCAC